MVKGKKIHSKISKKYSNSVTHSICEGEWEREKWVSAVLRLTRMKYNLEDKDFESYVSKLGRK